MNTERERDSFSLTLSNFVGGSENVGTAVVTLLSDWLLSIGPRNWLKFCRIYSGSADRLSSGQRCL